MMLSCCLFMCWMHVVHLLFGFKKKSGTKGWLLAEVFFKLWSFALAVDKSELSAEIPTAPSTPRQCVQGGATVEHQADHALVSTAWFESQWPWWDLACHSLKSSCSEGKGKKEKIGGGGGGRAEVRVESQFSSVPRGFQGWGGGGVHKEWLSRDPLQG